MNSNSVMYGCLPPTEPGFFPETPNWYTPVQIPQYTFIDDYPRPRSDSERIAELERRCFMLEDRLFEVEKRNQSVDISNTDK